MADYATLYESMMLFHWIFIINLYGSMIFCLLFVYNIALVTLQTTASHPLFCSVQSFYCIFKTFSNRTFSQSVLSCSIHPSPTHSSHLSSPSSSPSLSLIFLFVFTYICTKTERTGGNFSPRSGVYI